MCRSEPLLKMSLWVLLFLGLAEACIPREGLMSRLSPDDRTEEEMKVLREVLGLLSLQVLNEETNGCKEEFKPALVTSPPKKLLPKKKNSWNFLKCAYMVLTFLFVSYNKGDWCYCHYCNLDLDIRNDPCCSF
ncbi:epididymal protein 13 [Nycticebus coucang]|uniref:epididymal protein 13 n=1 Tax=Nycticebus coucang TaxID=9470 RepID=UPI00234E2B0D|nr:epididymal protein 13 [Nycticebus coucang]